MTRKKRLSVIGRNSLHALSNDNGQRCVNFAASRGRVVRSNFFSCTGIHKATWKSPDHQTETHGHVLTPRLNIEQLRNVEVAQDYAQQLVVALPTEEQLGAATLEDGWRDIRSAIGSTSATSLVFATPNHRNDWYYGECEQLKNEKNAAWARMLQHRTRANEARYSQARNRQNSVYRMKKRQQEEGEREAMEELYRAKDTRKFYEKLNRCATSRHVPR